MITYRQLTSIEEMEKVYQLEKRIWQTEIVPTHQTLTSIRNGGLMVGAYAGEKLIGFSYSFPGYKDGHVFLCSHMLGIDHAYRSKGIGEQLKQKQKELALKQGYTLMRWTFDPLETRNAYLNIHKLASRSSTYIENCYGDLADGLNAGLPTDRLEVEWHLTEEPKDHSMLEAISLNESSYHTSGYLTFTEKDILIEDNHVYRFFIPKDFQAMKEKAPKQALKWRLHVRDLCQSLFKHGYELVDVSNEDDKVAYIFTDRKDTKADED